MALTGVIIEKNLVFGTYRCNDRERLGRRHCGPLHGITEVFVHVVDICTEVDAVRIVDHVIQLVGEVRECSFVLSFYLFSDLCRPFKGT